MKLLTMSLWRENKYTKPVLFFVSVVHNKQHSSQHIINVIPVLDEFGRLSFASLDFDTN